MARENVVKLVITPEMDAKAVQAAIDEFTRLQKKLQQSKIEWGQISRQTKTSISNLSDIAKATKEYSKALSSGVKESGKYLGELGKKLEDTMDEADILRAGLKKAKKGSSEEQAFSKGLEAAKGRLSGLN